MPFGLEDWKDLSSYQSGIRDISLKPRPDNWAYLNVNNNNNNNNKSAAWVIILKLETYESSFLFLK